jgi:hypothetical protein
MSHAAATRLGWTLCVIAVVLNGTAIVLGIVADVHSVVDLAFPVAFLVLPLIGALIVASQPRNAIGWLFLGAALLIAVSSVCFGYGAIALSDGRSLPGGVTAAWLSTWMFLPAIFGIPPLLFLLFPDGHSLTPRWRPALWVMALGILLGPVGDAIVPGPLSGSPVPGLANPAGIEGPSYVVLGNVGWITALLAGLLATVSLVLRYLRSKGQERLQMRWFVFAAGMFVLTFVICVALYNTRFVVVGQVLIIIGFSTIPLATGLAILQYRLYDIDVVINRTLVYTMLTVSLALVYLASVLLLRLALTPVTGKSDLAVAASTLAVAALFRPLRARIQTAVDRRFYRRRYDAGVTLESFSGRLRQEVDLDAVSADLRSAVRDTMQPAHVSLWLRGTAVTISERPRSRKVSP